MQVAVNAFHGPGERRIPSLDKKLGSVCKVFLPYSNIAITWPRYLDFEGVVEAVEIVEQADDANKLLCRA